MNPKQAATDPVTRYLRDLEWELKQTPGVSPEEALADARELLATESTTIAVHEPGLSIDDYFARLQERFGTPGEFAADYAAAAKPAREAPGFAPGWRVRCTHCGRSAHASQAGITRISARSGQKYIIGYCRECRFPRWLHLTRDLEGTAATAPVAAPVAAPPRKPPRSRRPLLTLAAILAVIALTLVLALRFAGAAPPNFVLVYTDNLGYGDIGCFGHPTHRTPRLDRMAAEGMKLTHFYSTSGVCTPSRASLMTGCYPHRVGLAFPDPDGAVLRPISPNGLHPDEITVAEVLKSAGYETMIIGKWHLGDQPVFLPTRQGFDHYLGIPYSDNAHKRANRPHWPELPLMRDEKVIVQPVDPATLTKRYTEAAIEFIRDAEKPFFLYLPQAMPGSTTAPAASPAFKGKSANGPWGDSIEELDWSQGQILDALADLGLEENTLVIWTSDNGAPLRNPPQGRNLPMGGSGYTTSEGGHRVPCIARWPGVIPPGAECAELTSTIDILPTFARLAGAAVPADRIIDGRDISPLIKATPGARTPHDAFYYYYLDQLQCVRSGPWKLRLPLDEAWANLGRKKTKSVSVALYEVVADPGERNNLAAANPDIVKKLTTLAETARADIGDWNRPGANTRPVGKIKTTPRPQLLKN